MFTTKVIVSTNKNLSPLELSDKCDILLDIMYDNWRNAYQTCVELGYVNQLSYVDLSSTNAEFTQTFVSSTTEDRQHFIELVNESFNNAKSILLLHGIEFQVVQEDNVTEFAGNEEPMG